MLGQRFGPSADKLLAEREGFHRLFDIAISDGVITDEEKAFLQSRAQRAGIEFDELELMNL